MDNRFIRFKIYSKEINEWYSLDDQGREFLRQIELPYKQYDSEFNLVATGTEDFSMKRYRQLDHRWVYIWDGVKRNKGGYRWFTRVGLIRFDRKDVKIVKQYFKEKYNAALVELR